MYGGETGNLKVNFLSSTTGSDSENDEIEYLETKKVNHQCMHNILIVLILNAE